MQLFTIKDNIFNVEEVEQKIIITGTNLLTHHIVRSIDYDDLAEFIEIVNSRTNYYSFCTICGENLYLEMADHPISCSSKDCKNKYYFMWTNTLITDLYKWDKNILYFLIDTFICAVDSPKKTINPYPDFLTMDEIKKFTTEYVQKDFSVFMEIVQDDEQIIAKFNKKFYALLKFIVLSNNAQLRCEKIGSTGKPDEIPDIYNDVIYFEVIPDIIKQNAFPHENPDYLFHGSAIENWYSILRNGLKNYSGTSSMAHGAAYGNGIYFASNISTSLGYIGSSGINGYDAIGVVQILDKDKYRKTAPAFGVSEIYVVPDESVQLLKYIVTIPKTRNHGYSIAGELNKHFETRKKEILQSTINMSVISIKRLEREKNIIVKKFPQIEIEQTFNSNSWTINKKIMIMFKKTYPIDPPVVYNIINGAPILIKEISPKYWHSGNKIELIISKIIELELLSKETLPVHHEEFDIIKNYNDSLKMLEWI
jgi:hypothetical protein